jgi:hypothetical protein
MGGKVSRNPSSRPWFVMVEGKYLKSYDWNPGFGVADYALTKSSRDAMAFTHALAKSVARSISADEGPETRVVQRGELGRNPPVGVSASGHRRPKKNPGRTPVTDAQILEAIDHFRSHHRLLDPDRLAAFVESHIYEIFGEEVDISRVRRLVEESTPPWNPRRISRNPPPQLYRAVGVDSSGHRHPIGSGPVGAMRETALARWLGDPSMRSAYVLDRLGHSHLTLEPRDRARLQGNVGRDALDELPDDAVMIADGIAAAIDRALDWRVYEELRDGRWRLIDVKPSLRSVRQRYAPDEDEP